MPVPKPPLPPEVAALHAERWQLLRQLDRLLDRPMTVLAFVWLALVILDFTSGLSPALRLVNYGIWAFFGLDFLIGFVIAPVRRRYLRRNWLTALSLLLPAFGTLRVFRAVRALRLARTVRTVSFLRLFTSLNRSMRAIRRALGRRGVGYVALLTAAVLFAGAAGMQRFESPAALREAGVPGAAGSAGLATYGEALWWTAMILTTVGSEYWPQTAEGRLLAWLLSVYALGVFGYLAGTVASFFVDADQAEAAPDRAALGRLEAEVAALRRQLAEQAARQPPPSAQR